ncbi:MAG: hypothetical protein H5T69_19625, partial [Chloroflexi bacterium]|nr:hypothetical protein [Chloroflexota bacterium]
TSRPDIADLEKEGLDPRQSLQLINNEIDDLRRARQIFLAWVDGLRNKLPTTAPESISPAQFLRAWNDSSSRLARLIEARLRLSKQQGSVSGREAEAILDAAYRLIEEEDRHLQNPDC